MFIHENLNLWFSLSIWIGAFEYIIVNYFISYDHYNINNIILYTMMRRSNDIRNIFTWSLQINIGFTKTFSHFVSVL